MIDSYEAYLRILVSDKPASGESWCLCFLPAVFFPKESVSFFFDRVEQLPFGQELASRLDLYGRSVRHAMLDGRIRLCVEHASLRELTLHGRVHVAVPQFEVSFGARITALKRLRELAQRGCAHVVEGPLAYTYRLRPPDRILLDVERNRMSQRIQGMLIEDPRAFEAIAADFKITTAPGAGLDGSDLALKCEDAIQSLASGRPYEW